MMKIGICLFGILIMFGSDVARANYFPSGLNSTFDFSMETPFDEYVKATRKMVEKARVDLNDTNRDRVVQANTPFELIPKQRPIQNGILLIHGLSDSPYQMKDLATHFLSKGFLVRTILLPGHGTVPGDMLEVTWEAWAKATEYGVHGFSGLVDNLYLGGFSTGGELAIYMCLKGYDIKGLFLFAPVTKIKTKTAWFSTTFAAPDWLLKQDEKDFARYDSLASNAVAQVYQLTVEVDRLIETKKNLVVPVFIALSDDDITVSSEHTMALFHTLFSSDENKMVVYCSNPAKYQPDPSGKVIFKDSRIPDDRIVSFSHLSIIVSPDDPHYGKKGDYVYSPHPWLKQNSNGISKDQIFYGELTGSLKKKHYMQRLAYNPYFNEMTGLIDQFLANIRN
ncbi:MAG: alpha/beta hydrolase [Proteobacteria bacterium]|nr:alpha/beta hydrolase [Pseudomonadota bacterium]